MNTKALCRVALIAVLFLIMAAPPGAFGQGSGASPTFKQEELDQMLAPIALYPDSLLAQVLVASTYPLEVVEADRWVKQNKNLKSEQLNAALDQKGWDLSVKALAPFPQVLGMMSEQLEWTQKLGDAFLAQQADVMDSVQRLRAKAQAQGNLKTTKEQNVIVEEKTIVIEPASPTVVYVPTYNPTVVYGSWWYPAYPPYPYYPAGAAFTGAVFGFAAGVAVGAAWNEGWGHWDWHHGDINVNVNRNININNNYISNYQTGKWQHDPAHRKGVAYQDPAVRERYGQGGAGSADARRDYRGYSRDAGAQPGQRPTADQTMKSLQQREGGGAAGGAGSRSGAGSGSRAGAGGASAGEARRTDDRSAFGDAGSGGRDARMNADRGRSSRELSSGAPSRAQGFGDGGFGGGGGRGGGGGHGFGGPGGRR